MIPKPIDFLVVTPFDTEWKAVVSVFREKEKARECIASIEDELGAENLDDRELLNAKVFMVQAEEGYEYETVVVKPQEICRVPAAVAVRVALRHWHPLFVLLVGIAGALPDAGLTYGQVVVPAQIYDYERASSAGNVVIHDLRSFRTNSYLRLRAPKFLKLKEVLTLLSKAFDPEVASKLTTEIDLLKDPETVLLVKNEGNAISGDKKIKDVMRLPDIAKKAVENKIFCVEMEAGGVGSACVWDRADFLMIRGISDIVGSPPPRSSVDASECGETDSQVDYEDDDHTLKEETQKLAAVSAAEVAFKIISGSTLKPATRNPRVPVACRLPRPIVLGNVAQAFDNKYPLMYVGSVRDYELLAYRLSSQATDSIIWVSNGSPLTTTSWEGKENHLEEWDERFQDMNAPIKARVVVFRDENERAAYVAGREAGTSERERILQFTAACMPHLYFTTREKIQEVWAEFDLTEGLDMGFAAWVKPDSPQSPPEMYCFCSSFNSGDFQSTGEAVQLIPSRTDRKKIITVFSAEYSTWEANLEEDRSPLWQAKGFYEKVIMQLYPSLKYHTRKPDWIDSDPSSITLAPKNEHPGDGDQF